MSEIDLEEAASVQEGLKKAYDAILHHEKAALQYGNECNIMDALHQMTIARDVAHHLEDVARANYGTGLITQDEYLKVVFGVESYLSWDLQEKVASTILGSCDCRKKEK